MIKATNDTPSYEKIFIRQALFESSVRLDGRGVDDCRDVNIKLARTEKSSTSEVQLGDTLVICIVTGDIVTPYPDRPTDGILQFQATVSTLAESSGFLHSDLSRLLERAIRESESIDTESLCIIGGEKVWMINCEVKVVDCTGGNVIDACMLAAMSALRAFRKPETSVVSGDAAAEAGGEDIEGAQSGIIIHHSDEREPMPLALHHTPLSVTLGVFKNTALGSAASGGADGQQDRAKERPLLLVSDPALAEEAAMDGKIVFSINGHRELCAMNKPGGVALASEVIVRAAKVAVRRAEALHEKLAVALAELETTVLADRERRQETLRILNSHARQEKEERDGADMQGVDSSSSSGGSDPTAYVTVGGIDRNDPILAWSSLHQAAGLWNETK